MDKKYRLCPSISYEFSWDYLLDCIFLFSCALAKPVN